jgi:flagellar hook-basal body complex protein FliE
MSGGDLRVPGVGPKHVLPTPPPPPIRGEEKAAFKDLLLNSITEVQRLQTQADQAIKDLAAGEIADVSQALIAVEKADIAFTTMMQMRNKIIEAYQEVMRMSI